MKIGRIKKQKKLELIVISFAIPFIVFLSTYSFMINKFNKSQRELLEFISSSLKVSIEENYKLTHYYERNIEEELYMRLKKLSYDMRDMPLREINDKELNDFKDKYDLTQLALLKKEKNGNIYIEKSTMKNEEGTNTSSWGYWNVAFNQLMKDNWVSIDRGYSKANYWVGPKSYLYEDVKNNNKKNYYKFAYYFNEQQEYLINGIMSEKDYSHNGARKLNSLLEQYKNKIDSIEMIGIIDKSNWRDYEMIGDGNTDPIIVFGSIDRGILEKKYITYDLLDKLEDIKFIDMDYNGGGHKLALIKLDKSKVICAFIKKNYFEDNGVYLISIVAVLSLLIGFITSFIINKEKNKYDKILKLEQDRLKAIEQFKDALLNVPDYIFKCVQKQDGTFYAIYNDGRLVKEEKYVSEKMEPRPMVDIYPVDFIEKSDDYLKKAFNGEKTSYDYDNKDKYYEVILMPNYSENNRAVLGFINDVTKYMDMNKQSSYMAYHDQLTGLLNRHSFNNDFNKMKEENDKFCLYYLDLDGFKKINDNYGHEVGDKVLKQISTRLKKIVNNNKIYRVGGDEFVVMSTEVEQLQIENLAQNIIDCISKDTYIKKIKTHIGVSIGVALYPVDGVKKEQIITIADKRMYKAKDKGKNTYFINDIS